MRVGFAGLGRMGTLMAANCARAGHDLTIWNRTCGPAQALAERTGATIADTPADLAARSDVVIAMLADDRAAEAVHGAFLTAAQGAPLMVEMGTISTALVARLAGRAAGAGRRFVDAPVSGATQAARDAQLLIMAGAGANMADTLAPVFDAMARRTIWLGASGAGAVMKLCVNMMIHGINQTLAEALTLAEGAGIATDRAFDVIEDSAAAAPMVKYRRPLYLDETAHPVSFTVALAAKDLRLALALAEAQGTNLPQTDLTAQILAQAEAADYGQRDMAAILDFMREARR